MTREEHLEAAGERLAGVLHRATAALAAGDMDAVWQALDVQAWAAHRAWDQLLGRPVPPVAELEAGRQDLVAQLQRSLDGKGPRPP